MKMQVEKVFNEYDNKKEPFKNLSFTELSPFIERAIELDFIEILSVLGISGCAKAHPNNIIYQNSIIFKENYREMWLLKGFTDFHAYFKTIVKQLLNKDFNRIRFNISLTITKIKHHPLINDYHEFEFLFNYFGNNDSKNSTHISPS